MKNFIRPTSGAAFARTKHFLLRQRQFCAHQNGIQPILSISSQGMVSVSSRPNSPNRCGRPSKSRLRTCAVCGSSSRSSALPGRPHWTAARPLWRKAPGMSSAPLPAVCSLLLYAAGRRLMQTGPLCYTGCSDQLENSPIQIEVCVDV